MSAQYEKQCSGSKDLSEWYAVVHTYLMHETKEQYIPYKLVLLRILWASLKIKISIFITHLTCLDVAYWQSTVPPGIYLVKLAEAEQLFPTTSPEISKPQQIPSPQASPDINAEDIAHSLDPINSRHEDVDTENSRLGVAEDQRRRGLRGPDAKNC